MKLIWLTTIIVLAAVPAHADAFMTLFMERQSMIEIFHLDHVNDCVGFDEKNLRASLNSCDLALKETVDAINAGNQRAQAQLLGVLAMDYLARSKIFERLGQKAYAKADCDRAVKYAGLIHDAEKLAFFQEQCS